ncbi:hypothetical protein SAMN05216355_11562 [Actinomyces ruminicola]|uniref:DUF5926 domain-containing protein n=1 Tax=Actinomyces ruminicola TaxID=332524 RepID=A0A1H0EEE8_9ACTO|nr:DUF5926 family protein [Actinomyces ruminicola]SDN80805.1 hypothetical protein SAMN05216355_11562 [Actinomyces ruminicola]
MSKKNRQRRRDDRKAAKKQQIPFVARPFEGLAAEQDLVAMMQIIPAASMTVRLDADHGGQTVQLVTLLPELARSLKRADDEVLVAMQTTVRSGDASRDVAAALLEALDLEPGTGLSASGLPGPGERLQDILDAAFAPSIDVRESFDFWLTAEQAAEPEAVRIVEDAKEGIAPTAPVPGVEHAYWCRMNGKEFVRWVRGEDEDDFFNAFARVHAAHASDLEEGARFLGAFRACGLAIPVWELVPGTEAEELTEPMRAMAKRLEAALAEDAPLDAEARRAKAGIISRQVNL